MEHLVALLAAITPRRIYAVAMEVVAQLARSALQMDAVGPDWSRVAARVGIATLPQLIFAVVIGAAAQKGPHVVVLSVALQEVYVVPMGCAVQPLLRNHALQPRHRIQLVRRVGLQLRQRVRGMENQKLPTLSN